MSGFIIARNAGGSDVPAMYRIYNTNLDDYFAPEAIEYFMLQWPRGQFIAETITGSTVGALSSYMLDGQTASISLLAVDSDSRGLGAGSALLDAFLPVCMYHGLSRVQLEVRVTNAPAISFYERRGFRRTGVLPHLYNDGGDAFRMVKDISHASIARRL